MTRLNTNDLIGIQYLRNGADPSTGFDCWGLVSYALRMMGRDTPAYRAVASLPDSYALMTQQVAGGDWIEDDAADGNVVAFFRRRWVAHVGLYVGGDVLHTGEGAGVLLQPLARVLRSHGYTEARFYRWREWV